MSFIASAALPVGACSRIIIVLSDVPASEPLMPALAMSPSPVVSVSMG
jgi:hypothetical protein